MHPSPIAEYTYGDFAVATPQPALRDRQIKTSLTRIYQTVLCVLIFSFVWLPPAFSEDTLSENIPPKKTWTMSPVVGLSVFTGLLGVEVQRGSFAFTTGFPGFRAGFRWYLRDPTRSWFVGPVFDRPTTRTDPVTGVKETLGGFAIGVGYRWRSGTDGIFELGGAIGQKYEETRPRLTRMETFHKFPLIGIGYSFW